MTPFEVALRFTRQRGTTTADPDFIVAYLRDEAARTRDGDPLRLSPHPHDRVRIAWSDIKTAFRPLAGALERFRAELDQDPARYTLAGPADDDGDPA